MATRKAREWGLTHFRVKEYSFEWKITNFKFHCEPPDRLESPLFGDEWCLTASFEFRQNKPSALNTLITTIACKHVYAHNVLHKGMVCFSRGTEHKFEIKKDDLLNSQNCFINGTLAIRCAITAHSTDSVSVESSATKTA